jgi:hypothetical protein
MSDISEGLTVTDHCLLVAKIREKLTVGKRSVNKMDMDRFSLKGELRNSIRLQSKTYFQLWRT